MRIYAAGLTHETGTFAPGLSTIKNFEECYLKRGGGHESPPNYWIIALAVWAELAKKESYNYVESLATGAIPSAPLVQKDYLSFVAEIIDGLKEAHKKEKVDIVLLNLHGAMIAEGCNDCEGDIISQAREVVGEDCVIAVICDPHAHLSQKMLEDSSLLMFYREYPHTDVAEVAEQLFNLAVQTAKKQIQPKMLTFDCHMITQMMTQQQPMKGIVAKIKQQDGKKGIVTATICHSFPWGDSADAGVRTLVIYDEKQDNAEQHAKQLTKALGLKLYQTRNETKPNYVTLQKALEQKVNSNTTVFADYADNPGGGSRCRSTFMPHDLLKQGVSKVACSSIHDAAVVEQLFEKDKNSICHIKLGGSDDEFNKKFDGEPLTLDVQVVGKVEGYQQPFSGSNWPMGDMIALKVINYYPPGCDDIESAIAAKDFYIVVNSIRGQTFHPDCFSVVGINPKEMDILVVKSMYHYRHEFSTITNDFVTVGMDGLLCPDISKLPYKNLPPNKTFWPLKDKVDSLEQQIITLEENPYTKIFEIEKEQQPTNSLCSL